MLKLSTGRMLKPSTFICRKTGHSGGTVAVDARLDQRMLDSEMTMF